MTYPPVPLDATAGDLAGRSLAVVGTGPDHRETLVIVEFGAVGDGVVDLQIADTALRNPVPMVRQVRAPVTAALRELVLAHAGVTAQRAGRDVDVQWPDARPHPTTVRMALKVLLHGAIPDDSKRLTNAAVSVLSKVSGGLVALGSFLLVIAFLDFNGSVLATAVACYVACLAMVLLVTRLDTRYPLFGHDVRIRDGQDQLVPSRIIHRIPAGRAAFDGHRAEPTPADRVRMIKDEYGRLLTDICYRIENSALFDGAVSETSLFQVALLRWDAVGLGGPDADRAAAEVEASFAAARAHAEKLGWEHLPTTARAPARRARLAAITALGDGPEGERAAARSRVADILGSLALYYLPPVDPDTPRLIGQRRAIEPAP